MARLIREDVLRDLGRLWGAAEIRGERLVEVTGAEQRIVQGMPRYKAVADVIGCPWWLIGIVHGLECSWSFSKHLHNGDPLGAPTSRVPADRPLGWMDLPPADRTWERSALDACRRLGWDKVKAWTIPEALYRLEAYNGFGYRSYHPDIPTPYLWAATTLYGPPNGKYIEEKRDGKWVSVWKPDLVSQQVGSAAVLKRLLARGTAFPEAKPAAPASLSPPAAPSTEPPDVVAYRKGSAVVLSPNFNLREFDCHCTRCNETRVSLRHIKRLQALRDRLRKPITITSGFRCARHNAEVGGVTGENGGNVSRHVLGTATDIKIFGMTPAQVAEAAEAVGFDGIGIYRTFTHVDSRGSRARWNG